MNLKVFREEAKLVLAFVMAFALFSGGVGNEGFSVLAEDKPIASYSKNQDDSEVETDTTAPDAKAYIKFISDTVGANDTNRGAAAEGKWSSNIFEMANDAWNKIWGKKEVKFEVYVRDVMSGIGSITMSYNGETIPAENLRLVAGLKAFTEGAANAADADSNETGYTVYEGFITTKDDVLAIQNFQIDSLTDVAGNTVSKKVVLGNAENIDMICLDAVAPNLISVQIDGVDVVTEEKYFYNGTQQIVLTIEERFFGEETNPDYPDVFLGSRVGSSGEFEKAAAEIPDDLADTKGWNYIADTNKWQKTITLPASDKEMEYQVTMEAYQDPAGNLLTGVQGVDKSTGSFQSKTFVIDHVPPQLLDYSVSKSTVCNVDGIPVYKNDTQNDDLTVKFTIDDNAAYYKAENLVVNVYKDAESEPILTMCGTDEVLKPSVSGRNHEYEFTFDGGDEPENEFYIEITYKDAAGNNMIGKGDSLECTVGSYKSDSYMIDHIAPIFYIEYSDAARIVKDGVDGEGKKPLADHIAYYNSDIKVICTFDEKYANSLEHYELMITKDGKPLDAADQKVKWTKPENGNPVHELKFTIAADTQNHTTDGNYQIVIKYRDCAENFMAANNEEVQKLLEDGVYKSPVLVIDTTAPEVTTSYTAQAAQLYGGRDYFNIHTGFHITVADRNIRYGELKAELDKFTAKDMNGSDIDTTIEEQLKQYKETDVWCVDGNTANTFLKVELALTEDANYDIPVDFTDLAGNKAIVNGSTAEYTEFATIDTEQPTLELSYSITDSANYLEWGYLFAKKKMTVTVNAADATAGIQMIKFCIVDEEGKEIVKTKSFEPSGKDTYLVEIPLKKGDFKGSIFAEIFDYSTNKADKMRGHIIESASKHSATGRAEITTITSPSRTVNGVDFYNSDVKFKLLLEDTYSGLGSWRYVGGNTLKDKADYKSDAGTDLSKEPTMGIVYKMDRTLTLDAQKNNENEILVKAGFIDNAGHQLSVEEEYNIDVSKPIITVEYDLNNPAHGKYYKETRTATVKIRERNFDPADVQFLFTSTDGPRPEISGWIYSGTGDDTIHTCTVVFSQDSDYTFTVKFMDMAGNAADYNRVDEFTIDKTVPVANITYDNNSCLNEYYYDTARTATIDILEHNFDPAASDIMVTADGSTTGVPHISKWTSNGDHNIAKITFSKDAEYTFDIAGVDLALNELDDYTQDYFVVDQTAPTLEIFDIEHMSANNGVVRPGIRYFDTNYDEDGTRILMTGYHNGVVEMTGTRKLEANGFQLKLNDFAYIQQMDDLYTMHAAVYDLAGNSSEETVMFSVNRFGSVYTFDEATDAFIGDNGKYYTNKEQQLVITETNVDTLEFREITCNLNGKLTTLKEGVDYTVRLDGNETTWKRYTYIIKDENFAEEGTYILTIYSEDRAANTSDNHTKGKKIEFVVDKTNPSVLISGVENEGQYRTNNQEMTIDIEDNIKLSQAVVTIDGVEKIYDAASLSENDGKLVLNISSANHWQEIRIVVTDAAGNVEILEDIQVLVTANILVQFFMNKPVFYGISAAVAALAAGLLYLHKKLRIYLFNSSSS